MIEINDKLFILKCPGEQCNSRIRIGEGTFVGGINERGGIIIQCSLCQSLIPMKVKNPFDATGIISGGEIIDKWDDDIHNENQILEKHGLSSSTITLVEKLLVLGYEDKVPVPEFNLTKKPVFTNKQLNYETLAYAKLKENKFQIDNYYNTYKNGFFLKGKGISSWSTVFLEYEIEGVLKKACFAKTIKNEKDLNSENLYLIGHSDTDLKHQINGIFSKTNCLEFLELLLNRWRYVANEVLIVVPFIGYNYSNSLPEVKQLWEWLQLNMNVEKTNLVTKKGTFNLFKKAQSDSGIEYDFLVEWGLLEPLIKSIEEGEMTFFERSHAKYYVGVFDDKVEILSGSFNIHKGPSFENISFENYNKEFFLERYLHMFKEFEYSDGHMEEPIHIIEIGTCSKNFVYNKEYFLKLWNELSLT